MTKMYELSDAELDAVAAGVNNQHNLVAADVIVKDNEIVKDVNVDAHVLTGPSVIIQR